MINKLSKTFVSTIALLGILPLFAFAVVATPQTNTLMAQTTGGIVSSVSAQVTKNIDCEVGTQTDVVFNMVPLEGAAVQVNDHGAIRWFDKEASREGEGLDGYFVNGTYDGIIIPKTGYVLAPTLSTAIQFTVHSACPGDPVTPPPPPAKVYPAPAPATIPVRTPAPLAPPSIIKIDQPQGTDQTDIVLSADDVSSSSTNTHSGPVDPLSTCTDAAACALLCGATSGEKIACADYVKQLFTPTTDTKLPSPDLSIGSGNSMDEYYATRTGARTFVDSDNDGISDFDEINIYHTNPNNKDTDGDGIVDGTEIAGGTNPVESAPTGSASSTRDDHIVFEDPRTNSLGTSTLLATGAITVVATSTDAKGIVHLDKLLLKGTAPANSYVTLYIYSEPIVVTIKADATGAWTYTLDKELPDGNHQVYSAITDSGGKILAKSAVLPFVKEAAAVNVGANDLLPTASAAPSFFSGSSFFAFLAIIIGIITLAFLVLGLMVRKRNDPQIPA